MLLLQFCAAQVGRTWIIIKQFYGTTDAHANNLKHRRQNRTTADENKDIEIILVRKCQVRKNLNQVVCEGRKAHWGWELEHEHEVNGSVCFNCHMLFILPSCTNYLHCNFQWIFYCLLLFAVPGLTSREMKYNCHCHMKEPNRLS